jgi:peptidoglycan-associated lipoprotein
VKFNVTSQERRQPLALAVRLTGKFPTGDRDAGAGTGEFDGFADLVLSREAGGVEFAGFGGLAMRGDPDDVNLSDGLRWGAGAGFPSRGPLRVTGEVFGEWAFEGEVTAPAGFVVGSDGSLSPATSRLHDAVTTAAGLTWQHRSGLLLGAAMTYRFGLGTEDPTNQQLSGGDAIGMEFRIGFHRGVGAYVPPPPAVAAAPALPAPSTAPTPEPAAAAPAQAANRAPVVRAVCDPCTTTPDGVVALRAEATDPDGDALTIRWSTTGGTIADTRAAVTEWRAETSPGLVTLTVVAEDGRGAMATDTVTIAVIAGEDAAFEDVHFDFDRYNLRQDALAVLEPVITALTAQPAMRLLIEGHTCDIGTVEYNLALGERRAASVRDYLVRRGIAADRISTMSFGEEKPAHDNTRVETRRLNRRAVLVVRAFESN